MNFDARINQRLIDIAESPDTSTVERLTGHLIASYDAHLASAVIESDDPEAALRAEGFVWLADALFGKQGGHRHLEPQPTDGTAAAG